MQATPDRSHSDNLNQQKKLQGKIFHAMDDFIIS